MSTMEVDNQAKPAVPVATVSRMMLGRVGQSSYDKLTLWCIYRTSKSRSPPVTTTQTAM